MIATSIALTIWSGGLAYVTGRDKKRQVLEEHDVEADTAGDAANSRSKGKNT